METIDVSRETASVLEDTHLVADLPTGILEIIQDRTSTRILEAISEAALIPRLTDRILAYFEDVFPSICADWFLTPTTESRQAEVVAAFSRILPFAPFLAGFLERGLNGHKLHPPEHNLASLHLPGLRLAIDGETVETTDLNRDLLATWRLSCFDSRIVDSLISPRDAQRLFVHESRVVRYLSIRIFCLLLHASDTKLDALIATHLPGNEAIHGDFDGHEIDYGFLPLFEKTRIHRLRELRTTIRESTTATIPSVTPQPLSPLVVCYGRAILPRQPGAGRSPSRLVITKSTRANLEHLSRLLQKPDPILIHGPPGSGKTALVHEVAGSVGAQSTMVTLHLNEQTDAKMLIGLYTTGATPGGFEWRAGILTTAVREGRWVLIEDLDRAPNEVISTLLPLVERRELLIPSRGELVRAPSGFRLIATLRSSRGLGGKELLPNMLGLRFWQPLPVRNMSEPELQQIIHGSFPLLHKYVPDIISVYRRLCLSSFLSTVPSSRNLVERQASLRDLLKWCRRLADLLSAASCKTGEEPITETTRERMFMEAVDCFVGSLPDSKTSEKMLFGIAQEMSMPPEKVEHYLDGYIPSCKETDTHIMVGRAILRRRQKHANQASKSKRPFASTNHAKKLLERIAVSVKLGEPVLLVGETGIGKTTVVQQLAESLGHKMVAVNLSQQSESGDLLGGFKPVSIRTFAVPLEEEFEHLFSATGISVTKNQRYLDQISKCFAKSQWARLSKLWREAPKMFKKILADLEMGGRITNGGGDATADLPQPKRRRTESKLQGLLALRRRWDAFSSSLDQFDVQIVGSSSNMAFSYIEGNIVKAARNGDWVLLDEINLATPDTLESISDLLVPTSDSPSLLLSEKGEIERIRAHPDFRIFGAMNPATDVGKRDLPLGIRSRFTEFYVSGPDRDLKDLLTIIKTYLGTTSSKEDQAVDDVARLYLNAKRLAEEKRLVDGANEVAHFSLRTLTRVLTYANDVCPLYGLRRALFEGFSMGFLTLLSRDSEQLLLPLMYHHLLDRHGNAQQLLSQTPRLPSDGMKYVRFKNQKQDRQYWMLQGEQQPAPRTDYIITPSVERNLLNLVRATSTRRFPILIQGPTSSGKTSMIEYLANFSGNKFVRINNHEHTDLQEYLGTYVSGADGKLHFQEGLLVEAIRKGYWTVLDELNLAPTDVLEALNRLLDDNRELLIPETQEIVKPHHNFVLFATQNPPSLYGGRKVLSRAFRNRFLELHFDDIPQDELEFILQRRSRNTSPPDCRRIVSVYKELSRLRQTSRLFEQKDSFATLRDLFRWALRDADSRDQIAAHGFMLLAERVRDHGERMAVKSVIEGVFKVTIMPEDLYSLSSLSKSPSFRQSNSHGVVWTLAMRRLLVLVSAALRNNEPVLLVGETGCGKTTVCQVLAEQLSKDLHIVNAHQNTETGDLIGSQRPVRNRAAVAKSLEADLVSALATAGQDTSGDLDALIRTYRGLCPETLTTIPESTRTDIAANEIKVKSLFEWSDGSLVEAMKRGQFFLLDEISLAEDSVLERLNTVLEPGRGLLLAEKGSTDSYVTAINGFQFFATMNPGGDFGKKELSPALRNRFTEIWVPSLTNLDDVRDIVQSKLHHDLCSFAQVIIQFAVWFGQTYRSTSSSTILSMREILVWIDFLNKCRHWEDKMLVMVHGAATVYIDSLGANPSAALGVDGGQIHRQRQRCLDKLGELLGSDVGTLYHARPGFELADNYLTIGGFGYVRLPRNGPRPVNFAFDAPTTRLNAMRVVRALLMDKPILLEGSPGVGKTTLVTALAGACGMPLTRINLSDQTDLMDLFGTDVPVEGAEAGTFAWRDAPFLQAMQHGGWVLLDEMNLASQSVLEGLNACLDHRGEVYIAELDQVFKRHPEFRLFAAQNPHHQGGGRKGLPASFVNRFIVVYADVLSTEDLDIIAGHSFPSASQAAVKKLIDFISSLEQQVVTRRTFGAMGGPWEFNLRDILRWLGLLGSSDPLLSTASVSDFLDLVVRLRFRTDRDRDEVTKLFSASFQETIGRRSFYHNIDSHFFQVGMALLKRDACLQPGRLPGIDVRPFLPELESLMICIQQNMACILTGPSGAGKSVLLQHVATLAGRPLVVFPLNADTDAMDLVGGFEQADPERDVNAALYRLGQQLQWSSLSALPGAIPEDALRLLRLIHRYLASSGSPESEVSGLLSALKRLSPTVSADSSLGQALRDASVQVEKPMKLVSPRFEWMDGVIVKALQEGQWLVLDNANLCSASVLDRLNSLLEPNGHLSINEHCEPGGEPRIVRAHPDFRVFLTVDPRHGELSRAMRNRAIELYIRPVANACAADISTTVGVVEGSLQRFLRAGPNIDATGAQHLGRLSLEGISGKDLALLPRYASALRDGKLWPSPAQDPSRSRSETVDKLVQYLATSDAIMARNIFSGWQAQILDSQWNAMMALAQPIHPLNNGPMIRVLERAGDPEYPFWAATIQEFLEKTQCLAVAVHAESRDATSATLTSLNRLQRSFLAKRIPAVSKDSTVNVSNFLLAQCSAVESYLREQAANMHGPWLARRRFLRILELYLVRTHRLVTTVAFDEATFLAHLSQGPKIIIKDSSIRRNLCSSEDEALREAFVRRLEGDFEADFGLTTGLSMQLLWTHFKPSSIQTLPAIRQSAEIEQLATKLDALRWRIRTPPSSLIGIQVALSKTYQMVRNDSRDAQTLVSELGREVSKLASQVGEHVVGMEPFLRSEFESLRKILTIDTLHAGTVLDGSDRILLVMSNFPTLEQMRFESSNRRATDMLQSIDYLLCSDDWTSDSQVTLMVASKLEGAPSLGLESLGLLETELPLIGRYIASKSAEITGDHMAKVNTLLWRILLEIAGAHTPAFRDALLDVKALDDALSGDYDGWTRLVNDHIMEKSGHLLPVHLVNITSDHLAPAVAALCIKPTSESDQKLLSAIAWIQGSIAAIKLYVPNKPFDPQLPPMLDEQFHSELRGSLEMARSELVQFEGSFTGQDTNLRAVVIERELAELGAPPPTITLAYRPPESQMGQLQSSFRNILKIANGTNLPSIHSSQIQDLRLIRDNVQNLLYRMRNSFDAYQDITRPVIGFVRGLELGLHYGVEYHASLANKNATEDEALLLLNLVPFTGGELWNPAASLPSTSVEFFSFLGAASAVESLETMAPPQRLAILDTIHSFYEQWSKKMESDRKAEELKNRFFRFRGSAEDEEEFDQQDFDDLFPAYDKESSEPTATASKKALDMRGLSVSIADAHRKVFLQPQPVVDCMHELMGVACQLIARTPRATSSCRDSKILPAAVFALDKQLKALARTEMASNYNFYQDSNLPEARRLASLIEKVQGRFRELQTIEEIAHMEPLADVLSACDKVNQLAHTEPLAKILPKLEGLHAGVYEWQFGGWARQAHSALALHDAITDTIVRWRRLELSTWARLFEMETAKCYDDAKSWWFVAYGLIVANPLRMVDAGESLQEYAVALMKDLQPYFLGAVLGQYSARLVLLRQLQRHLTYLEVEYPALSVVSDAIRNFLGFYGRFDSIVADAIWKGRQPIEKTMKDVLLLASWRDTNINALRESARKSHLKLFRAVRKFRIVLSQDAKPLIDQGVPDQDQDQDQDGNGSPAVTIIASYHFEQQPLVAEGSLRRVLPMLNRRLSNVSKTVSIMHKIGALPVSTLDAEDALDSFIKTIKVSMAELKRATPSTLTEENGPLVRHLKARKRKLFADTLREIRRMGFKYSMNTKKLSQQESIEIVLASIPHMGRRALKINGLVDEDYYRLLEQMAKARLASRGHSDELTNPEVERSIGFLEGLLSVALDQRRCLGVSEKSVSRLNAVLGLCRSLEGERRAEGCHDTPPLKLRETRSNWIRVLRWLICVIDLGTKLVSMHASMGCSDNSSATSFLEGWSEKFTACLQQVEARELDGTLVDIVTGPSSLLATAFRSQLSTFTQDMYALMTAQPALKFILEQVLLWAVVTEEARELPATDRSLEDFASHISNLCDRILVSFEKLAGETEAVPRSTEADGWAVSYSDTAQAMIKSLHIDHVTNAISSCLDDLGRLELGDSDVSRAVSVLVALARPIMEQYASVCHQRLATLVNYHHAHLRAASSLTRSFVQIATNGFCTPLEKSDETKGDSGRLESGTGLGEGEGENDISKDIKPDEDVTELAQEKNMEPQDGDKEMEDEKDAVDMAGEDLEGEMGSIQGEGEDEDEDSGKKNGDEKEEDDMDEEAGDVDDLDPTAVDEKMWDGDGEKAEKEQQGHQEKGKKDKDDQVAAGSEQAAKDNAPGDETADEPQPEPGETDEITQEVDDAQPQDGLNYQDQHVAENDALALPDDMELDMDDGEASCDSEDGLDDLDDLDNLDGLDDLEDTNKEQDAQEDTGGEVDNGKETKTNEEADVEVEETAAPDKEEEEIVEDGSDEGQAPPDMSNDMTEEDKEKESEYEEGDNKPEDEQRQHRDDGDTDVDKAAPSKVRGGGQDNPEDDRMDLDDSFRDKADISGEGDQGEDQATDHDKIAADGKGSRAEQRERDQEPDNQKPEDNEDALARPDPFRELGDALERWHRQQNEIKEAAGDATQDESSEGIADREFQHVRDENDASDTQALGSAREDEVQPFDDAMAIDEDKEEQHAQQVTRQVMAEQNEEAIEDQPGDLDRSDSAKAHDKDKEDLDDDMQPGVRTQRGAFDRGEPSPSPSRRDVEHMGEDSEREEEEPVLETSTQLESTHLSPERALRDYEEALQQWSGFQASTQALSAALTAQLRLILTPSQATKLSGSFRTGKRLNIKRIIPYIASSYKRDKIWMRRSVPTKRAYQILLCLDDSRSMGESSAGQLALESLVMVSRSLAMLEAGQVGVLGFGGDVFSAHDFADQPLTWHDAGAKVLRQFTFAQDRTDVALLVRHTIDRFREARIHGAASSSSSSADLWQLALILSDGLTPSSAHDDIRRLLREAIEERVMVVFIVMDDKDRRSTKGGGGNVKDKGDSVLDLREARFVPDGEGGSRVVIERYLDTFPFQYYLIVHRLEDLPGALAGLLRTWFAEVNS